MDGDLLEALRLSEETLVEDEAFRRALEASLTLLDYTASTFRPTTSHLALGHANAVYATGSKIVDSNLCLFFSVANALRYFKEGVVHEVSPENAYNLKKEVHAAIDGLPPTIHVHTPNVCEQWEFNHTCKANAKRLTKPNNNESQEEDTIKALALFLNIGIRCYKTGGGWIEYRCETPPHVVYISEKDNHFSPLYPTLPGERTRCIYS